MVGGSGLGAFDVSDHDLSGYSSSAIPTQIESFLERVTNGDTFDGSKETGEQEMPFAIQVSFPDPHSPNEVPRKYADMFPPESINLPPTRYGEFDDPATPERNRVLYEMLNLEEKPEEEVRNIIGTYLAMTRFVDDGIGRILDKLDDLQVTLAMRGCQARCPHCQRLFLNAKAMKHSHVKKCEEGKAPKPYRFPLYTPQGHDTDLEGD